MAKKTKKRNKACDGKKKYDTIDQAKQAMNMLIRQKDKQGKAAADRIESLESELESANEKIAVCDLDIQYLQARMQRHLTLFKNKENK